ncbi:nematocyst expressed protein 4-like isoform X2 [Chironomus tepperi]|uniref:nematocyst expressed protein 4-like isoform X2 n=1 Tax=Chironomus tepperi TaxID=113505 RepID=UPI00391F8C97
MGDVIGLFCCGALFVGIYLLCVKGCKNKPEPVYSAPIVVTSQTHQAPGQTKVIYREIPPYHQSQGGRASPALGATAPYPPMNASCPYPPQTYNPSQSPYPQQMPLPSNMPYPGATAYPPASGAPYPPASSAPYPPASSAPYPPQSGPQGPYPPQSSATAPSAPYPADVPPNYEQAMTNMEQKKF